MRIIAASLVLVLVAMSTAPASAQLRLSRLIGDGMVVQRDVAVPVWGWADPGTDVTVAFEGRTYDAAADASGRWVVRLPAMPAGGPYAMTVSGAQERHEIRDIWVGDVWIASGQSNMEWTVADAQNAEAEIAAAGDPKIRHFKVPTSWAFEPEATLAGGHWAPADPEHVGAFTAVGYFFARALREHVDVPIGLINTSWGGSRIEPWMSAEALGLDAAALDSLRQREEAYQRQMLETLRARIGTLPEQDAGLVDGRALWADPALDDADWTRIAVPGAWEQAGYEGMDGIGWYRTTFDLTDAEARAGVRLGLGTIDDSDVSYVNGHEVGRTESAWNRARVYEVPPSALQAGRNVVAVRVEDTGGGGASTATRSCCTSRPPAAGSRSPGRGRSGWAPSR